MIRVQAMFRRSVFAFVIAGFLSNPLFAVMSMPDFDEEEPLPTKASPPKTHPHVRVPQQTPLPSEVQQGLQAPAPVSVERDAAVVLSEHPEFSVFVYMLKTSLLLNQLRGKGPFTVFAPTNEAFKKLPPGTVEALLDPDNIEKLRLLLAYHVVLGKMSAKEFRNMKLDTATGDKLQMLSIKGTTTVDGANVANKDIDANNGVIHAIDDVLLPP